MGAQKFMVRRNYLGAMSAQARHCVTLRWPLPEVHANRRTITVAVATIMSRSRTRDPSSIDSVDCGPGRAIGRLCVSVWVHSVTLE